MRHFMAQFGPCLKWPWTKLTDVPDFTDELVDLVSSQSDAQSGAHSIRELERIRDDNLVAILQALKVNDWGAGRTLAAYERRLVDAAGASAAAVDRSEEHTSELQSLMRSSYAVFCLKKKNIQINTTTVYKIYT